MRFKISKDPFKKVRVALELSWYTYWHLYVLPLIKTDNEVLYLTPRTLWHIIDKNKIKISVEQIV